MSRADDDFDDRPRRRRRDDEYDDSDDRPRRAKASGSGMNVVLIVGLIVGLVVCCPAIGIALLLPAVQKVRESAARLADLNSFKQIALAFHEHERQQRRFPPADGNVSWRVHVLPYLGQRDLYNQFDPGQSWDAARNRPHANVRVPAYLSKNDPEEFVQTRARVFTGPGTLFPPGSKPLTFAEVKDGTSATFLVVEATESVPWPQPRELPYADGGPLPQLGHPQRSNGFIMAMVDGSAKFVPAGASDVARRAAITANGGEAPPDF